MKIVDVRGKQCPAPLIATRKMLREAAEGDSFRIITGSRNALENISKFLSDNKTEFEVQEEADVWAITIIKQADKG